MRIYALGLICIVAYYSPPNRRFSKCRLLILILLIINFVKKLCVIVYHGVRIIIGIEQV